MQRDDQQFPNDDNGDVLWQMAQDGDDFNESREIDFSLVFTGQQQAEQCALYLLHQGQKISLYQEDEEGDLIWDMIVHIDMQPDYAEIVEIESWLITISQKFFGEYDGWGCMAFVEL